MPRPQEAISSRSATVQAWWVVDSCSREMDGFSQKTQRIHQKLMCFVEVCHLVFLLNKEIKIDFCGALFWAPFFGDTCLLSLGYWKKNALQSLRWQEIWVRSSRSLFSYLYPPLPLPSPGTRDGKRTSTSGGGRLHANPSRIGDARTFGDARSYQWGLWMSLQKRHYK